GCGDVGQKCNFDLNIFYNGPSMELQSSQWDCKRGGETVFTMGLFGDFTGVRSDIGDFIFNQDQCGRIDFETLEGTGMLTKIEGNVFSQGGVTIGNLAFDQVSDDFGDISVACDLVQF
ncbi:MAG: hypothetical protein KAI07_05305, partial [Deltaproteobacteria bacterium]|nr:hypothetical protein [Deltaproteobacteria bacterium]